MRVLFRADADAAIGTGHIMRCLALAEALAARGAAVRFLCARLTAPMEARLRGAGFPMVTVDAEPGSEADAAAVLAALAAETPAALVVDGYGFGSAWRCAVRGAAAVVFAFDDLAELPDLAADLVANAGPAAATLPYGRVAPEAQWLLGPAYFPMRGELAACLPAEGEAAGGDRLLVSFGGSDPAGLSVPFLAAARTRLDDAVGVDLAAGGTAPRLGAIRTAAAAWPCVALHVDTRDMAGLMRRARLAVAAAGGTLLELAAFRVPMVLAVVADNQAPGARAAEAAGWAVAVDVRGGPDGAERLADATAALWRDAERRAAMARAMRGAVDGRGAARLAEALLSHPRRRGG
ncbi:MAG TPA: UDP-2,4-diacetamido-2,4,6-trideoxy-beta-L-altropyranose hydrolase [Azospirillum sp.]|nr:UDP-2,4-diacetamido-2,4,6-trideoxy-beta-L-altropyranose hydrolase [Azospirillum sp.]